MHDIHEVATLTSKGQLTLPKAIRQALGVSAGGKVAFDLRGNEVIVTGVQHDRHVDPAIEHFLSLLEQDIGSGTRIFPLPEDIAKAMLSNLGQPVELDDEISGNVAL